MQITGYKTRPLVPPKDSLLDAIAATNLTLQSGDILAISSKVVSIHEGQCIPTDDIEKDTLVQKEADWIFCAPASRWRRVFTISKGALVGSAGIDESNGSDHYILFPTDPFKSAKKLRKEFQKIFGIQELGLIITDSTSIPMRRGAIGFALAWDGIDPLRDYRGTNDIFGRTIKVEMANLIDSLAAAAVLEMGEGNEQTPVAVLRDCKNISFTNRSRSKDQLLVEPEDDLFAPLIWRKGWKRGG
ncbi:coenzyme F420-0:L-glutamate ligase [Patescibacteria group bacterium]|nr:coenzyme F420-0:L-glutamate ligase [Patescibacteria group bacterium]MBU1755191.1 coenzyme F420-0:L-glutamate ligase [Patescibacteria group bacterium]